MIITIDPGHTKNANAGVIKGYYEGNAMYKLANFLEDELLKYSNVQVVVTRKENEDPTTAERGSLAVNSGSKVFISLHSNAVSNAESAAYVCGFYSVKRTASKSLCGKLVSAVTNVMKEKTDAWNRGALTKKTSSGSDYYGVIRNSVSGNSPVEYSFIIEHGFHTNRKECEFLSDDNNLKKIAEAEAKTIAEYFGIKKKANFAVTRTEIPSGSDMNDYIKSGEYYFSGAPGSVLNSPPTEREDAAFLLDVNTCYFEGIPYAVQTLYYISSGKEYVRGIYARDGYFDEVHKEWSKK
jgi:N-acetylmuramoyl-L-alanine amidase